MNHLEIFLLISHEWIARPQEYVPLPTHWAIFVSRDIRAQGTLFNTLGAPFYGYTVDIRKKICPITSGGAGWLSLGYVHESQLERLEEIANSTPEPVGPNCSERMLEIARSIVLPEKPPGFPPSVADSEAWASMFVRGLINQSYLEQFAMEKLRTARQLDLSGPPINV
ncbi:hypothetical protein CEP54_015803 [Fusarium duplospermum]|uniref:Uncharacterized protein n=1 Tax=Fusarium duplospermum TaxID=1325734 RepID=A0A428NL48_9HYPO|nr:hypothetical protein CEP54_015803 [Fusarium duplospermum]